MNHVILLKIFFEKLKTTKSQKVSSGTRSSPATCCLIINKFLIFNSFPCTQHSMPYPKRRFFTPASQVGLGPPNGSNYLFVFHPKKNDYILFELFSLYLGTNVAHDFTRIIGIISFWFRSFATLNRHIKGRFGNCIAMSIGSGHCVCDI